jgi:hypothetical protein
VAGRPLGLDQKLTATARALQFWGILICYDHVTTCACFICVVNSGGAWLLDQLLLVGVDDWWSLSQPKSG